MNNIIIEIVKCKIMKLINRETIFLCSFIIVDVISRSIMRAQGKEYHMGKKSTVIKKDEK